MSTANAADFRGQIEALIGKAPAFLFMKGTRVAPECGFSASVIEILDNMLADYATFNVLEDNVIRERVKEYADWPTIPQLYIGGEFVGGADLVREMNASGELRALFEKSGAVLLGPVKPPTVTFTQKAKDAVMSSRSTDEPETLRLTIDKSLQHGMTFDERQPGDFEVDQGAFTLLVDPSSARRCQGVTVDYVSTDERTGFKIENPAEKPKALSTAVVPEADVKPPNISVTEKATAMFTGAIASEEGEGPFGIRIKARRMGAKKAEYELDVIDHSEKPAGAFDVQKDGFVFWVDRFSAPLLSDATIDFVEGEVGAGFKFTNPSLDDGWNDERAAVFEKLLDDEINPGIASHGGNVELLDLRGDTAYVMMGGGCQGCGMAGVTLEQGIADRVRTLIPSITRLVDTTDHAAGTNPYYGS